MLNTILVYVCLHSSITSKLGTVPTEEHLVFSYSGEDDYVYMAKNGKWVKLFDCKKVDEKLKSEASELLKSAQSSEGKP